MDTRTLCLGALALGDATGYEIKKRFEDTFGYFMDVSYSAVYPALAELRREGLVTCTVVEQETRPDKKVYRVTEAGRRVFLDALVTEPARHRVRSEFMLLIFFAHLLPAWRLGEVLEERLVEFEKLIALAERWLLVGEGEGEAVPAGVRFTAGYGIAVMRAACDYIRRNRHRLLDGAAAETAGPEAAAQAAS
jgi:DNA-binding PadR family transcriptional regulator